MPAAALEPGDMTCHFATAEIACVGTPSPYDVKGADIMVQTADAQGLRADLDVLGDTAGQKHSYTQADVTLLTARVEALAKHMIMNGASDAEISAAVGMLTANSPELAHIAQQVAQKQIDADGYNLFSTRDAAGTGQERSEQPTFNPLAAPFALAIASETTSLLTASTTGAQAQLGLPGLLAGLRPDGPAV